MIGDPRVWGGRRAVPAGPAKQTKINNISRHTKKYELNINYTNDNNHNDVSIIMKHTNTHINK